MIRQYFEECEKKLKESPFVISQQITFMVGSEHKGHIEGEIVFIKDNRLDFFELLEEKENTLKTLKYRFQYMKINEMIFRYDNAPHHADLETFPHHKHIKEAVLPSNKVNLLDVLDEIEKLILKDLE